EDQTGPMDIEMMVHTNKFTTFAQKTRVPGFYPKIGVRNFPPYFKSRPLAVRLIFHVHHNHLETKSGWVIAMSSRALKKFTSARSIVLMQSTRQTLSTCPSGAKPARTGAARR